MTERLETVQRRGGREGCREAKEFIKISSHEKATSKWLMSIVKESIGLKNSGFCFVKPLLSLHLLGFGDSPLYLE